MRMPFLKVDDVTRRSEARLNAVAFYSRTAVTSDDINTCECSDIRLVQNSTKYHPAP